MLPSPADTIVELSTAQRRLWFLDQLREEAPEYLIPAQFELAGPIEPARLRRALGAVIGRHDALRMTFGERGGEPVGVVAPPGTNPPLPVVDVSADPRGAPAAADELAAASVAEPMNLAEGPLVRASLVRLGPDEHRLLLCLHHAIADGWSLSLIAHELAARYRDGLAVADEAIAPPALQVGGVAAVERERLEAQRVESAAARLAGVPVLELPTDRPRPPIQGWRGSRVWFDIEPETVRAASELGSRLGASPFMVGLAAYSALLHRWSGQEQFAVGAPVAARVTPELESVVGLVAGTLVLRADLSEEPTFAALVDRVRDDVLDAFAHQAVPFDIVVDRLDIGRDPARSPVFQVAFALQNVPSFAELDFGDVRGTTLEMVADTAKFDISLTLHEHGAGLRGELEYATDLFDAATAGMLAAAYRALLRCGTADPDRPVSGLDLVYEPDSLSVETSTTSHGEWLPVHMRVERWSRRTPETTAIRDAETELTYAELGARADALAHRLRELGAGPDTLVGVCLERSSALAVALLAVIKAGSAYVPLDPAYPSERLTATLGDAAVCALVTRHDLRGRFGGGDSPVLTVDAGGAIDRTDDGAHRTNAGAPSHAPARRPRPPCRTRPRDLAYVVYTSGTTGRPKGVAVEHAGLANLVAWHLRVYETAPGDRCTLIASPGFDASVWELWTALAAGATLIVPTDAVRADPAELTRWLTAEHVTETFLPTPLAEAVLAEPWPAGIALRRMLTGGDVLRGAPAPEIPFELVNHYGPTENSVVATATAVPATQAPTRPPAARPSIGSAIDATRADVLDSRLCRVPDGMVGELCLAGASLARGYLGAPAATAERFVPNPHGAPGTRLYRTGDLARRRAGRLEFLGRRDGQVKVRGFRIELAEVETRLREHPLVVDCAVAVVPAQDGASNELAAFVVPEAYGSAPTASELRRFVRDRLPAPMTPASFALLERIPVTAHGKVDRRALSTSAEPLADIRPSAPPRTETERAIASVWQEILELPAVGVHESFFEVGGHSFLAVKLQQRLQVALGRELPVVVLFEHPTIAALAAHLDGDAGPRAPETPRAARRGGALRRRRELLTSRGAG